MSLPLIESLRKARSQSPDNNELLRILISTLHGEGLSKEAYDLLKEGGFQNSGSSESALTAAEICLSQHDLKQALEICKDNDTPEGNLLKSRIHLSLNQAEESLKFYNLARSHNSSLENLSLLGQIEASISNVKYPTKNSPNVIKLAAVKGNSGIKQASFEEDKSSPQTTFKDVGGLEDIKDQIHKKIILPFTKPSIFEKFRKKAGGGVLLYGPPGCGKTLLARATAGECKAKFYNVEIADILDMYIGEAETKLHEVFENARRTTPSIIFFDEMEAFAGKRSHLSAHNGTQLVSQFLSEMDGFTKNNEGVLVLGATNTPWHIDGAFRRPGRFDRVLFVAPPDFEARVTILNLLLADRPFDLDQDIRIYAKKTVGFSGADLSNLVETACDYAIEESLAQSQDVPISIEHLEKALKTVRPTVSEWLTTAKNYAKYANEGGQYNEVLVFLEKFGKR